MTLSAGSRLGPYEIVGPLGAGGMGEVYRARDTRLHREVAIKVLPASFSQDADRLRRFEQEARAASALNHPGILTIHDFGSEGGAPYVVAELLEGETLREKLAGGRLAVRKTLDYAAQISRGLAAAHERGIVHRDLKPENLFVTRDGRVKILDFGLAKLTHPETSAGPLTGVATETAGTEPGVVMGTAGYMSPEQVRGQAADHRSDIFSFGAVLYEMLTGRRAFGGDTAVETMSAILRDDPPEPSRTVADAPPLLDRIVRRCLEKSPAQRFQSASDLAYAIDEVPLVSAATQGAAAPVSRPRPAYRGIALAFVAVASVVALIAFDVGGIRKRLMGGTSPQSIRSLAVLPLENLSRDPEQEYFADGMTEALITSLARIRALRVISRTSVMRYKETRKTLPEIGRELDVDGIVEGSVLRAGERVRITAQLVRASTDAHLWANDYERDLRDVLALQSEIARAVAEEVRAQVTPQERAGLSRAPQVDPEAHEAYLKGRFQWNKRTPEGFRKAFKYFEEAIEKNPSWAPPYAGLADTYMVLRSYGDLEPGDAGRRAKATALKALELDDSLAEAHTSLATVYAYVEHDWEAAEREFRRAIQLNPSYATAHQWYGEFMSERGRFQEGLRELQTAETVDPLSLIVRASLGRSLYYARQYDKAIAQLRKTLGEEPDLRLANLFLARAYLQKEMSGEAIAVLERTRSISESSESLGLLGFAYAAAGRRKDAIAVLERLREISKERYVSPVDMALVYTGLRDKDRAFEWLDRTIADRPASIGIDPAFDFLHSDPRFTELVRRIGLAPPG